MSTATLTPEQVNPKLDEDRPSARKPRISYLYRQSICVFSLMFSDVLAIGLSLRLAIFLRAEWLPEVHTGVQPMAFPFRHYLSLSWLGLLLVLLLAVEGLVYSTSHNLERNSPSH